MPLLRAVSPTGVSRWLLGLLLPLLVARVGPAAGQATDSATLLARAKRLHREIPLIDTHNDLALEIRARGGSDLDRADPDRSIKEIDTDIPRLKQGGVGGVFWAAYAPATSIGKGALRITVEQIDLIHRMIERSPSLAYATTAAEIERIHREGKIASLLGVEGGHSMENSLGVLREFYARGVRYMTLTHSATIDWADAATDSAKHGGLSRFGEEVVREMNRLGMMVDISHVSDATMSDALRVTEAPGIFSHSSARALANHPRNVPDSILAKMKANRGVVMVNIFPAFIDPKAAIQLQKILEEERVFQAKYPDDPERASREFINWFNTKTYPLGDLAKVVDHIEHIRNVAGGDHVGWGADFGSISQHPKGLEDVSKYPAVTVELLRRGWSDEDVKKFLGGNILRVMREVEAVAARLQKTRRPSTATIEALDGPAKPARPR